MPIPTSAVPLEFLSFELGGCEYGLDAAKVQELRQFKSLERFASDGNIIGGVALSHGVILPIVDLRAGAEPGVAPGVDTEVIILRLASGPVGMVVERVTGIAHVRAEQVAPLPGVGEVDYLLGMARLGERRLILVDIDHLMSLAPEAPKQAA